MSPFEFVNEINFGKKDLFEDPQADKDYIPFIVNRALSYFPDTVLYANEMNKNTHISKEMQFDFLRESISKRKRFSKWLKKPIAPDDLTLISNYYKYSGRKALEVLSLLSSEQIECIRQEMHKGGK